MGQNDLAYVATMADPVVATVANDAPRARGSNDALELSMRSTVLPRLVRVGERVEQSQGGQRFVPVRLLGKGGIGEVTLVQDNDIDRSVALKRLRSDATSEEMLFRFAEEIRTVGQLEHPNIAPVHDVGVDDAGRHYFVMRYVDGETLEHIIARLAAGDPGYHARFPFAHRVQVFFGVLHAIAYAHSKQIIHRDIKPSNIMVGPYGEVVVMDWGVAKHRDAGAAARGDDGHDADMYKTRHGSLVGTPAYMSPEQAMGQTDQIDQRSDVYALAAVLYELLTLQHYLPGRSSLPELLSAIISDEHTMAAFVRDPHQPPVPAELGWFIETGLTKDPAARFQSVSEMSDHLERVMAGAFPVQCPATFLKKAGGNTVRYVDRHPVIMMAATLAVLSLVGLGIVDLIGRL
jgi:serine/threonine-protein kinase